MLVAVLAFQPLHADGENYKEQLRKQPKTLHYTDTIRSANKQQQFLRAIELAPSVFVYKEIVWKDASTVTVKGMRFNPSMDNTLKCEIVEKDPGLGKRLRRLNTVTRPLNGVVDLTDAIMIVNHSLNNTPPNFKIKVADMNGDGYIDLTDAIIVVNRSMGNSSHARQAFFMEFDPE